MQTREPRRPQRPLQPFELKGCGSLIILLKTLIHIISDLPFAELVLARSNDMNLSEHPRRRTAVLPAKRLLRMIRILLSDCYGSQALRCPSELRRVLPG